MDIESVRVSPHRVGKATHVCVDAESIRGFPDGEGKRRMCVCVDAEKRSSPLPRGGEGTQVCVDVEHVCIFPHKHVQGDACVWTLTGFAAPPSVREKRRICVYEDAESVRGYLHGGGKGFMYVRVNGRVFEALPTGGRGCMCVCGCGKHSRLPPRGERRRRCVCEKRSRPPPRVGERTRVCVCM